jgi:lysophospholipase L1-like esterase
MGIGGRKAARATLFATGVLVCVIVVLLPALARAPSARIAEAPPTFSLDDVVERIPKPAAPRPAPRPTHKTARPLVVHTVAVAPRKRIPIPNVGVVRADVDAIGDSVMEGAASQLRVRIPHIYLSAITSQQVSGGIKILRALRDQHKLGKVIVIHLGTNGRFLSSQFDEIMKILQSVPKVVFVNVKASRPWEAGDNQVIAAGVRKFASKAVLVDWHSRWRDCSGTVFYSDGIHLTPAGASCYARLVAAAVAA